MSILLEIGNQGEKIALEIIKQLGFKEFPDGYLSDEEKRGRPSWDILAARWGQKYAINVKHGNNFIITPRNVLRLEKFCNKHNYKPAYLLIINKRKYFFYSLDNQIPKTIDKLNSKLEDYHG